MLTTLSCILAGLVIFCKYSVLHLESVLLTLMIAWWCVLSVHEQQEGKEGRY
jgi:hypothetical protein